MLETVENINKNNASEELIIPEEFKKAYENIQAQNVIFQKEIQDLKAENKQLTTSSKHMIEVLRSIQNKTYGRKSEKLNIDYESNEIPLFPVEEAAKIKEIALEATTLEVKSYKRKINNTRKKYDNLPVIEEIIKNEENCSECNEKTSFMGYEVSETIEYQPSLIYKKRVKREKTVCNCCNSIECKPTTNIIPRSFASASLVSHIIASKFIDHLPYYRIEKIFLRDEIEISINTMCSWISYSANIYLKPIAEAIRKEIIKCNYIKADETPVKVQDPKKKNSTHTGYFWGMLAPPGIYHYYSESRSSQTAIDIFGSFELYLQTDLYSGYNVLKVLRLACFAHIRRKFFECSHSDERTAALTIIGNIYEDTERKFYRKNLDLFKNLLLQIEQKFIPLSGIVKAAKYALKQWDDIERIFTSSEFHLDNNDIERMHKYIATGKKNWLFAGSHESAQEMAIIYTIVNSCRLAEVNVLHYLEDIFTRVLDYKNSDIVDLIPINWKNKFAEEAKIKYKNRETQVRKMLAN